MEYRSLQNPCNTDCINFHIWIGWNGLESRAIMDQPILTTTILLQVQTNFHIWKLMQSVLQGFCKLLYFTMYIACMNFIYPHL